jgi:uncharacterized damage-inducible protein DinB
MATNESAPVNPKLYRLEEGLSRDGLIEELAAMPERLREALESAPAETLERRAGSEEWSAIETLRHVRDVVQVYGMRFKWMILQDDPLLADYDENRWAAESPDGGAEVRAMLDEIASFRAETVRLLRSLNGAAWQRTGRHETLGAVTLEPYVRHEVEHERQHLSQIRQAVRGQGAER